MKNPCQPDCPRRKVGCQTGCKERDEWVKFHNAEVAARQKIKDRNRNLDDFKADALRRRRK